MYLHNVYIDSLQAVTLGAGEDHLRGAHISLAVVTYEWGGETE